MLSSALISLIIKQQNKTINQLQIGLNKVIARFHETLRNADVEEESVYFYAKIASKKFSIVLQFRENKLVSVA